MSLSQSPVLSPQSSPSPPTVRYKMTIAYRGTAYHGWQFQTVPSTWKKAKPPVGHGLPTIQETLRRAMEQVLRHPIKISGSSRTDSGVHAKAQVAHFDTMHTQIPTDGMRRAINHQLPDDILVRSIEAVPPHFDATSWTTSKRYQYFIWHHDDRPLFFGDLAWHRWKPLDIQAMQAASKHLVGTKDFSSFCTPGHGRYSTVRTVMSCEVSYRKPKLVISTEGSGFLWNMVRIMVGTLVEVGLGQYKPDDIVEMLAKKRPPRRRLDSPAPWAVFAVDQVRRMMRIISPARLRAVSPATACEYVSRH